MAAPRRCRTASALAPPLLLAALVLIFAPPMRARAQDVSGIDFTSIPAACLPRAATFQTDCAWEIEQAQAALGLTSAGAPGSATTEQAGAAIEEYTRTAPPPSVECCRASCAFNNEGCVCSPAVAQVAAGFLTDWAAGARSAAAAPPAALGANATANATQVGEQVLLSVARAFQAACAPTLAYPLYAGPIQCASAPAPGSPQATGAVAACGPQGAEAATPTPTPTPISPALTAAGR